MAAFDPAAATQAYLSAIPAATRAAADASTEWAHLMGAAELALTAVVCWAVLKSGLLGKVRARWERERPRPWLVSLICAVDLLLIQLVVGAPLRALAGWRAAELNGVADLSFPQRLAAALTGSLPVLAAMALAAVLMLALIRWLPRVWWAVAGAVMAVLILAIGWAPSTSTGPPQGLAPLPAGPVRAELAGLVARSGLPVKQIYVSDEPVLEADAAGSPAAGRLTVTRQMLAAESLPEARANVGHVLSHYAHADLLSYALLLAALTALGLFAADRLFRPVARLMRAGDLDGPADPRGLPVLLAIGVLAVALATPVLNGFNRAINVRADQYSLDLAREPDGLARHLIASRDDQKAEPSPVEEALFYDHPSLKRRIRHAMDWKAAHPR